MSWMEGHVSVEAAILGRNRPIEALYLRKGKMPRSMYQLRALAERFDIPVAVEDELFFVENAGGQSHGGVLAKVGPRRFCKLPELLAGHERPFIVMLDGIEDPFNFGQAVRALYASGVDGLVVRSRNWLTATAVVTRASAGATELMPTAVAETALEAAAHYRANGLRIACTARESARSIYEADLTKAMFLLIGGEKRGITRSFLEQSDVRLEIPYGRTFERSLGAASSTAVIAFEQLRQRSRALAGSPDAAEKSF